MRGAKEILVWGRLRQWLLATVAITSVVGVGCGGSAGDVSPGADRNDFSVRAGTTPTVTQSMTKPKFVAIVNDLCRRKWRFILHAFREYRGDVQVLEPQLTGKQVFVKATRLAYFASIGYHIYDHVLGLGAPPGEKQVVEELLGSMQEGIERGQRLRPVTSRGEVEALFADYNRIAGHYGLDECLVKGKRLPHGHP
jgi:hypothetical protein